MDPDPDPGTPKMWIWIRNPSNGFGIRCPVLPDPQFHYESTGTQSKNRYRTYGYALKKNDFVSSLCSLAQPVSYRGGVFGKKKLKLTEGQPLPATFSYAGDRFIFVVHRDLTVSFNGTK